jgi:translation initiation factor 3 subunit C
MVSAGICISIVTERVNYSSEFDKLTRLIQRQNNVSEPIPSFYIRTLSSLESSVNSSLVKEKASSKKMNATNAKALTAMKQKIKKAVKEHEIEIKQYQQA